MEKPGKAYYMMGCVRVCGGVCYVMKMAAGATRSLENSNFGAIPRGSGAFAADGLSFTHTRHTWSQRCSSPSAAGAAFVAVAYPFPSKPSDFYAQLDSTYQP